MSLEQKIEELTEAVAALTEAMSNGNGPAEEKPAPKKKAPAKRGRKPPVKAQDEDDDDAEDEKPAPKKKPAPKGRGSKKKPSAPSQAEVRNKVREVTKERGADVVNEILEEFDVAKFSELDADDFAEFLEACDEALAEGDDGEEDEDDDDI